MLLVKKKIKLKIWKANVKTNTKWYVNIRIITRLEKVQPSQHLPVQSQQWKHLTNVWNIFKGNDKNNRTTSMTKIFYTLLNWFVNFEQVNVSWENEKKHLIFIKALDWIIYY